MPEIFDQTSDFLSGLPPYAIIGAVVVVILIIFGLARMIKRPQSRLTAFTSDTGSVLVSRKALQDLIRQTCLKDASVEAARPVVKIAGKKIRTSVTLRLTSPESLKTTTERLQTSISGLLQKSLSFDQIGPIEIMVTSFGKQDVDAPPIAEIESPPEQLTSLNPPESPSEEKDDDEPKKPSSETR